MKKFKFKDSYKGFTLIEVLVIMLISSIILAATVPLITKRLIEKTDKDTDEYAYLCMINPDDETQTVRKLYRNGEEIDTETVTSTTCSLDIPEGVKKFHAHLVPAGQDGYNLSEGYDLGRQGFLDRAYTKELDFLTTNNWETDGTRLNDILAAQIALGEPLVGLTESNYGTRFVSVTVKSRGGKGGDYEYYDASGALVSNAGYPGEEYTATSGGGNPYWYVNLANAPYSVDATNNGVVEIGADGVSNTDPGGVPTDGTCCSLNTLTIYNADASTAINIKSDSFNKPGRGGMAATYDNPGSSYVSTCNATYGGSGEYLSPTFQLYDTNCPGNLCDIEPYIFTYKRTYKAVTVNYSPAGGPARPELFSFEVPRANTGAYNVVIDPDEDPSITVDSVAYSNYYQQPAGATKSLVSPEINLYDLYVASDITDVDEHLVEVDLDDDGDASNDYAYAYLDEGELVDFNNYTIAGIKHNILLKDEFAEIGKGGDGASAVFVCQAPHHGVTFPVDAVPIDSVTVAENNCGVYHYDDGSQLDPGSGGQSAVVVYWSVGK